MIKQIPFTKFIAPYLRNTHTLRGLYFLNRQPEYVVQPGGPKIET